MKRIDENTVSMHVNEYRFFITQIKTLEAENTSLKRILSEERASFDVLSKEIVSLDYTFLQERTAAGERIDFLTGKIKKMERRSWYPGVIFGGGSSRDGGVQALIGLGWKFELF